MKLLFSHFLYSDSGPCSDTITQATLKICDDADDDDDDDDENQMKGCAAEVKVSDWEMNAWTWHIHTSRLCDL